MSKLQYMYILYDIIYQYHFSVSSEEVFFDKLQSNILILKSLYIKKFFTY